jgi:hypothetical protein
MSESKRCWIDRTGNQQQEEESNADPSGKNLVHTWRRRRTRGWSRSGAGSGAGLSEGHLSHVMFMLVQLELGTKEQCFGDSETDVS